MGCVRLRVVDRTRTIRIKIKRTDAHLILGVQRVRQVKPQTRGRKDNRECANAHGSKFCAVIIYLARWWNRECVASKTIEANRATDQRALSHATSFKDWLKLSSLQWANKTSSQPRHRSARPHES
jgi:hypothetical protein